MKVSDRNPFRAMRNEMFMTYPDGTNFLIVRNILNQIHDIDVTLASIENNVRESPPLFIHSESKLSEAHMSVGVVNTEQTTQNFGDIMGSDEAKTSAGDTHYSQQGSKELLPIDQFFSRPILLSQLTLSMSGPFCSYFSVWDLYSKIPAVRAKFRNYAYLKANMKVRIAVTGTQFHVGKIGFSYQPYGVRNYALNNLANLTALHDNDLIRNYLSQAPGFAVLDIKENKPLEMMFPFISTKPMHRLFNTSTAISATTSFDDLSQAGYLWYFSYGTLTAINSVTDAPQMVIYAWLEDVELGVPTGTQLAITTESKLSESQTGPIQDIATSALSISSKLEKAPVIGMYAKAASIVLSGVARISSLFGWSRPVIVDNPVYVKNNPFQNGANTIGFESAFKVTLDPEQGLTVDPRNLGIDYDDMVLDHISSINSYFTSFSWATNSMPFTVLWSTAVTPFISTNFINSAITHVQPTACLFAAQPFTSWRGDVEFTFEFITSIFHRGKLMIGFDPNIASYTLITSNIQLNKQYFQIVDIQETQTVSFCVNWAHYRSWCSTPATGDTYTPYGSSPTFGAPELYNGFIFITPFNELVCSDSTPVRVNCYVRCPNLQVNGMNQVNLPLKRNKTFS